MRITCHPIATSPKSVVLGPRDYLHKARVKLNHHNHTSLTPEALFGKEVKQEGQSLTLSFALSSHYPGVVIISRAATRTSIQIHKTPPFSLSQALPSSLRTIEVSYTGGQESGWCLFSIIPPPHLKPSSCLWSLCHKRLVFHCCYIHRD